MIYKFFKDVKTIEELKAQYKKLAFEHHPDKCSAYAYAKSFYNAGYRKEKTCKNITKQPPVDEFICSECGLILQDYCEKRIDGEDGDECFFEVEFKYCPNCGAKVVEE